MSQTISESVTECDWPGKDTGTNPGTSLRSPTTLDWSAHSLKQLLIPNSAQKDDSQNPYVPGMVANQAAIHPDALAARAGPKLLTYAELNAKANQVAHCLRATGVGPDVPVALALERSLDLIVAALGVLRAGGAYVPLDISYPAQRLAFMLEDAQVPVLLTKQSTAKWLPKGKWQVTALDVDWPQIARLPSEPPRGKTAGTQLAYVIYTSGSTGKPKGVEISHDSLLNLVCWHQQAFALTPADRATQLASPAFDAAVWELWPYLTAGASIHIPDDNTRVSAELLRNWLLENGITITFAPTALAEQLITLNWPKETALRVLLTGGDALRHYPPPTLPFSLVNNYGPTECTVVATSGPVPTAQGSEVLPSIGRPISNTQIFILDENLRQVPPGTVGELHIGGAGLARGYLNRPGLTAEKFILNPFSSKAGDRLYKTGDLARFLPDGQIAFSGRVDEQIKIRGYRIEPNEIISALNKNLSVQESFVVCREDPSGDKRLVAYIVPAANSQPSAGELRDFLQAHLPEYMIPAAFVRLDTLPTTPNGKIDRDALPAPSPSNTLRQERLEVPCTVIERKISRMVGRLLGVESVGPSDNFFLLGGHSLLGMQLISRLRSSFGVALTLRTLFDNPTVAGIAQQIERLIAVNEGSPQ